MLVVYTFSIDLQIDYQKDSDMIEVFDCPKALTNRYMSEYVQSCNAAHTFLFAVTS